MAGHVVWIGAVAGCAGDGRELVDDHFGGRRLWGTGAFRVPVAGIVERGAVAGLVVWSVVCVWLGEFAVEYFGRKDPGPCVVDEAAGICLTLLFQPMLPGMREGWVLGAAFLAFRLFDITKPPPARQLERLPAGWGILMDDLAAAVYANLLCQLLLRLALSHVS